ncbi:MAG: hypothetical protein JST89_06270 [Cyanobacteria bacterium SZAS-4]|nr:hypothetical protein [Cyanobacteria bacterium SZAS-4]
MLDSQHTKPSDITAPPPNALINDVQDQDKFWSDFGAGIKAGAEQSLHDGKGHLIRDGATAVVGIAAGHWGDVYATFGSKMPLIVGTALLATAISRHLEDRQPGSGNSDFDFGKGIGRLVTDMAAATGIGYLAGKTVWRMEGADHAEYLVTKNSDWRYVPAHSRSYGPKQYSFRAHYDHTGLTLDQKTEALTEFLTGRGQMSKFPKLMDRMAELHNPKLEGRSWTTKSWS